MDKKQFLLVLVMSFIGGIIGGLISEKIFINNKVFAENRMAKKIIEANEFRVIDDKGKTKATFGDEGLYFWADDESSNRTYLSKTNGLSIGKGTSLSEVTGYGMTFQNDYFKSSISNYGFEIRSTKKNETIVDILGKPLLQVGMIGQGFESRGEYPGIRLCDKDRRDRILIHLLDTGEPYISLNDDYLIPRIALGAIKLKNSQTGSVETRAASSLVMFNESGNVIWKAP